MKSPTITLLILSFLNLTGCLPGDKSETKAVRPALKYANKDSLDSRKSQALIYYTNEPAGTAGYNLEKEKIKASFDGAIALQPTHEVQIRQAKQKFENDYQEFNSVVTKDLSDIKSIFCKTNSPVGSAAILLTNASIIAGKIEFCQPNGSLQRLSQTQIQKFSDMYQKIKSNKVYEHSPLSHPSMVDLAISTAGQVFPSEQFEYTMVFKSHGSVAMFLTPKVGYEAEYITPQLIASFYEVKPPTPNTNPLDKDGLDKDGLDKNGLDKNGLDKNGLDKNGLEKDGLDVLPQKITVATAAGSTKEEVLTTLMATASGMFFNVVFFESCKSDLGDMLKNDLAESSAKPNIGAMFTSDSKGLRYTTLDWSKASDTSTKSLRDWLVAELNRIANIVK